MKNINLTLLFLGLFLSIQVLSQSNLIYAKVRHDATGRCGDSTMTTLTYYIRPDILRIDFRGPKANSSMIYQPAKQRVWVLYHHEKRFYSMNKEDIENYDSQIKGAAEEMRLRLEKLSERERKENMELFPAGSPFLLNDIHYQGVKKKDSLISQLICKRYDAVLEDGSRRRAYLNSFKGTGINESDLGILRQFSDFMGKGSKVMSASLDFSSFYKWDEGGYPVLVETWKGDELCNTLWMSMLRRGSKKDKFFTIPIEYAKMNNPMGIGPED
ncbi:MAG: hypothetical protein RIE58_09550 [Vicingaceae bacterium]